MAEILAALKGLINEILTAVLSILPTSPFTEHIQALGEIPFLAYLNWFIPVGAFIKIGISWLGAIALFYIASIALRWIKAIT